MNTWNFAETFPKDRVSSLLAKNTVREVAKKISCDMSLSCCHLQFCDEHLEFARIVYCIKVLPDTFDLFFNSPHGYRGAYYRSPGEGLDANALIINTLLPKLVANSELGATEQESSFIRNSISSPSAKMWLAENGLELCDNCSGEWGNPSDDEPEILNDRWEKGNAANARRGRKAPRLTKIRIFGAFLDERNNELVPARKRHRAQQLNKWGWS
jgi:hypothetical protein